MFVRGERASVRMRVRGLQGSCGAERQEVERGRTYSDEEACTWLVGEAACELFESVRQAFHRIEVHVALPPCTRQEPRP